MHDKRCPICRTELNAVVFTQNKEKKFEEYSPAVDFSSNQIDKQNGIFYENEMMKERIAERMRPRCPECTVVCLSMPLLISHLKHNHRRGYCPVCLEKKISFLDEQKTYSEIELQFHNQGQFELGIKHHLCKFCDKYFYDMDDFTKHMSREHGCRTDSSTAGTTSLFPSHAENVARVTSALTPLTPPPLSSPAHFPTFRNSPTSSPSSSSSSSSLSWRFQSNTPRSGQTTANSLSFPSLPSSRRVWGSSCGFPFIHVKVEKL